MIGKEEFDILRTLAERESGRKDASGKVVPPEEYRAAVERLREKGFVTGEALSPAGLQALEPYRVRNAIILAAGLSSRFMPLSLETPKGLLRLKGERLIERQIKQLHEAGITDITVVVGYRQEQFFFLEKKYGVSIVINPFYASRNNISSVALVTDRIDNTYICSSDHYFTGNIFRSHMYRSTYPATWVQGSTTDYSYVADGDRRIISYKTESTHEYGLVGPAYLDASFAAFLVEAIKKIYADSSSWNLLWEDAFFPHLAQCAIYVEEYPDGIIHEFDTLQEICSFDASFLDTVDSKIMSNICQVLNCTLSDISQIEPLKIGLTNKSFTFIAHDTKYVYRHPGEGTGVLISRRSEAKANSAGCELGLDSTLVHIDENQGWKISRYIYDYNYIDPYDMREVAICMQMVKKLHEKAPPYDSEFNFIQKTEICRNILTQGLGYNFSQFEETHEKMKTLADGMDLDGRCKVQCHNDTWAWNFLRSPSGEISLIDWEYAGGAYAACDVADFTVSLDVTISKYLEIAELYEGKPLSDREKRHYLAAMAIVGWFWFVWGVWKEACGDTVEELLVWYEKATEAAQLAYPLYQAEGE
ncbi:NTP transferase domain-containing protein [Desulfovibrio sp. OttesenSCG-928-G15]|nr:NTP transferase domain-containing protein [Desulfovibrio sp. OttesenSCG-928-G15]